MDEELDGAARGVGRGAHGGDLLQREFAREHELRQAHVLQKARLFRGADVALGAGVQLDGRQVEFEQAHVLNDERVHAGIPELVHQAPRGLEFVVAQDGVERDEHAGVKAVRMAHQPLDLGDGVVRAGARAERGATNVDGIGAVVDRFDADVGIARGGEQFEVVGGQGHGGIIPRGGPWLR